MNHSVAQTQVMAWLDEISPHWRRYVTLEPGRAMVWVLGLLVLLATIGVWLVGVVAILAGIAYLIYRAA
jgi:hypothetical protein